MGDITKVELGACSITFNGVDLGHTLEGCEFTYEPVHTEVKVDKYGETVVDLRLIGEKVTVKCKLAEFKNTNWAVAIPQGAYAGAANARRTFGAAAGKKGSDDAAQLVIHPLDKGTREHDIVLHKAYVQNAITIAHKNDEQKTMEVEFMALVDESKSDGNYLGLIGDSTA